jgi:carbon storage regulator
MLVLSRKVGESVIVGQGFEKVKVTVLEVSGGKIRLGFEADASIPINREEVWKAKQEG